jgi:hypothetical protein
VQAARTGAAGAAVAVAAGAAVALAAAVVAVAGRLWAGAYRI